MQNLVISYNANGFHSLPENINSIKTTLFRQKGLFKITFYFT